MGGLALVILSAGDHLPLQQLGNTLELGVGQVIAGLAITQAQANDAIATDLGVLPEPNRLPQGCIAAGDKGFMCDYALKYLGEKGLPLEEIDSEVHGAGSHAEGSDEDAEQLQESRG